MTEKIRVKGKIIEERLEQIKKDVLVGDATTHNCAVRQQKEWEPFAYVDLTPPAQEEIEKSLLESGDNRVLVNLTFRQMENSGIDLSKIVSILPKQENKYYDDSNKENSMTMPCPDKKIDLTHSKYSILEPPKSLAIHAKDIKLFSDVIKKYLPKCPKCKHDVDDSLLHCEHCGHNFTKSNHIVDARKKVSELADKIAADCEPMPDEFRDILINDVIEKGSKKPVIERLDLKNEWFQKVTLNKIENKINEIVQYIHENRHL